MTLSLVRWAQKLLLRNESLVAENRIFRAHLPDPLRLTNPERFTLAEIRFPRPDLPKLQGLPGILPGSYRPEILF